MRIVFFTREGFQSNELFLYMFAMVADRFPDLHIVAVRPQRQRGRVISSFWRRYWKKIRRLGIVNTLEIFSSYPLQVFVLSQDYKLVQQMLRALSRPAVSWERHHARYVHTINGVDAVQAICDLAPDVIIQAGAGILRPQLFKLAHLGTVNLHHGMAPRIRGMHSIYWALWERRPDWLGATVHWIDEGIDTGDVLAYAPVESLTSGEGYPALYVRATQQGVERLVETLARLAAGERWVISPPTHTSVYRSTMSGWKLMALRCWLACQRVYYQQVL